MKPATKQIKEITPQPNIDTLVSVCAIVPDDAKALESFAQNTLNVLGASYAYYELLLIDNGAPPDVHRCIQNLQCLVPNVRLLRLSRRYGSEVAIAAALDHCIGDYVVIIDPLKHPPELIPEMVTRAAGGCDAIVAEPARNRPSRLQQHVAGPVYRLASRVLGFPVQPEDSSYRVFSRRLVNSIIKIRSKNRSLSCINGFIGLQQSVMVYEPKMPATKQSSFRRLIRQLLAATDILVSNSAVPLRCASMLGLLASFVNLFYLFYILAVTLVKSRIAEGWLTTSLTHTLMFLLMFLIMTILSEYIARILDETKEQPLYFIESESNSTVSSTSLESLNVV